MGGGGDEKLAGRGEGSPKAEGRGRPARLETARQPRRPGQRPGRSKPEAAGLHEDRPAGPWEELRQAWSVGREVSRVCLYSTNRIRREEEARRTGPEVPQGPRRTYRNSS